MLIEKKLKQINYYEEKLKHFKIMFSENFYKYLIPKNLVDEVGGPNVVLKSINNLIDLFDVDQKYHKIEFLVRLSEISCCLLTYNQKLFQQQYQSILSENPEIQITHSDIYRAKISLFSILQNDKTIPNFTKYKIMARIERFRSLIIRDIDIYQRQLQREILKDDDFKLSCSSFLDSNTNDFFPTFVKSLVDFLFGRISNTYFEQLLNKFLKIPLTLGIMDSLLERVLVTANKVSPQGFYEQHFKMKVYQFKFGLKYRFDFILKLTNNKLNEFQIYFEQKIQEMISKLDILDEEKYTFSIKMSDLHFLQFLISSTFPNEEIYSLFDIHAGMGIYGIDEKILKQQIDFLEKTLIEYNSNSNKKYISIAMDYLRRLTMIVPIQNYFD